MIEASHGIEVGYCSEVQSTLNRYDDSALVEHLDKVPHSFLNQLNVDFYVKVATLSSDNHVSAHEAMCLFGDVKHYMRGITKGERSENDTNHFAWSLLVRFLRRKLMIAKLAMALFEFEKASDFPGGASMATLSTHPSHFKAHQHHIDDVSGGSVTAASNRGGPRDNQQDDASLETEIMSNLEHGQKTMPKVTNLSGSAASFGQTTKDDTFPAANSVLDGGSSVASPPYFSDEISVLTRQLCAISDAPAKYIRQNGCKY